MRNACFFFVLIFPIFNIIQLVTPIFDGFEPRRWYHLIIIVVSEPFSSSIRAHDIHPPIHRNPPQPTAIHNLSPIFALLTPLTPTLCTRTHGHTNILGFFMICFFIASHFLGGTLAQNFYFLSSKGRGIWLA